MTSSAVTTTLDFLSALGHSDERFFIDLRLIRGKRVTQYYAPASRPLAALEDLLKLNAAGPSIALFGVNPRWRRGGKDRDVPAVYAVVVDLDGKGLTLEEQQRRLLALAHL